MNYSELIGQVQDNCGITKAQAQTAVYTVVDTIVDALCNGDAARLQGFGTFEVQKRSARRGRNPQTGKIIDIPAKATVRFKASSKLKEVVTESAA